MQANTKDEELHKASLDIITRLKEMETSEKWIANGDQPCKMYKLDVESRVAAKGIHVNQYNIEKVIQFLEKEENLAKINSQLLEVKVLYEKVDDFKVNYMKYKGQWPVADRDFINVGAKFRESETKMYIGTKACNYPYPEVKGVVRGEVYIGGYIIEKVDETHTKVTYISDADLKGSIPGMIKNAFSVKQGETASKVGYAMKKDGF